MPHLFETSRDDSPLEADDGFIDGPGARGMLVRVAVERGIDGAETGEGLTYRAGSLELRVGQRVEVPLGRGNKPAPGIVVQTGGPELLGSLAAAKVKPVLRASGPALPPRLIELAQWMAEYYICPLGLVLATMLPASVKRGTGVSRLVEVQAVSPAEAETILAGRKLAPTVKKVWEAIAALLAVEAGDAGKTGLYEPRQLALKVGAKNLGPINRLIEAGLLVQRERKVVKGREQIWQRSRMEAPAEAYELTPAQRGIAGGIVGSLGSFSVHLLRGITGSGKTEVYMQAIAHVLERGQRALVLVPEISLTPQTAGRFITRFGEAGSESDDARGERIAVLHSGMPASERHRQWELAASGRARIVVGARSAIFAPLAELGLIVVDEEHASDYKQDQMPRYNGRDVAIKRAQLEGCPVVLGSATPSLESWWNAKEAAAKVGTAAGGGEAPRPLHYLWQLTERVGGGALPRVEVVDLAEERRAMAKAARERSAGVRELEAIGPTLADALKEVLGPDGGGQAILLLNRRGWSNYICCPDAGCGWVAGCDQCDSSMVLHRKRAGGQVAATEFVRCHHCQSEQLLPRQCAVCNRRTILLGMGTQRVEEELARKLRGIISAEEMVRVDGDSMRSAADYFRVLARFGCGEVKVLLGTQMISKGLDFPNVRLVGVINADTGLSMPDFRAAERTFQLVSQVAGRAGRGMHPGRVIVQTINPQEPAIELAARHDYLGFISRELAIRQRAGLPPAARMARVVVRDESPSKAEAHARRIAEALRAAGSTCIVQGPAPCPISRIANEYRFGVEVIARRAGELRRALNAVRAGGLFRNEIHTTVDVDPASLL